MKAKKGMGFKAAQKQIAKKQGISMERAGAILASGARKIAFWPVLAGYNGCDFSLYWFIWHSLGDLSRADCNCWRGANQH